MIGHFRCCGIWIQKERIRLSLARVDRLGQVLRNHNAIDRRVYKVPRPNALWHLDGHHKLIRWGIVIHGIVDGYSRAVSPLNIITIPTNFIFGKVVGLRAHTNNLGSTVENLFLESVNQYGAPSRVCGDRGAENLEVSTWMVMHRGPSRGSFLWGTYVSKT